MDASIVIQLIVGVFTAGGTIVALKLGLKSVVEQLSHDLHCFYPKLRGFSTSNLWRMRLFYDLYSQNQKLAPLVREISWSHIVWKRMAENFLSIFYCIIDT